MARPPGVGSWGAVHGRGDHCRRQSLAWRGVGGGNLSFGVVGFTWGGRVCWGRISPCSAAGAVWPLSPPRVGGEAWRNLRSRRHCRSLFRLAVGGVLQSGPGPVRRSSRCIGRAWSAFQMCGIEERRMELDSGLAADSVAGEWTADSDLFPRCRSGYRNGRRPCGRI